MKHFSILIAFMAFLTAGSAFAQNASRLNGKTYWYMMKNADGTGEEIHDNIRFVNNTVYSDRAGIVANSKPAKVAEKKISEESTSFITTVLATNGDELRYECTVEGNSVVGTVQVKKADGTVSEMVLRGMVQEEYLRIKKMKDDYQKSQSN
ncbi:MAG: hypothetical protein ACO3O0_00565 [Bacteroidia bacterium]